MYAAQTPRAVTVSLGVLIGFVVACGICVVLNIQRLHAALQLNPASLESTCRELEARRLSESVDLPAVLVPRSVPPAGLDVAHSQDDALARIGHMFPPQPQVDEVKLRLRAIFQGLPQLHDLPRNATVFLTFTNGHYSELMLNSLATIAALGLPAFVYCFDKAAVELCEDLGIPHFQPPDAARMMESADFRQDRAKFLEMGVHKPEMVERLFSEHGVGQVVLTDTDTIWLRDPRPYLARHPAADVFTTTDCNSHVAETYFLPGYRRCAHTRLGSARSSWGINTGVTVYRNRRETVPFLRAWKQVMEDADSLRRHFDDQASFMHVLATQAPAMARPNATFDRDADDPRVLLAGRSGGLKVVVLPSMTFPGGKTYFDYHLAAKYGTHPYVIHGTFQRYNNPGKKSRFREVGAWLLDDTAYYTQGRFMTVSNNVHSFIRSLQLYSDGAITQLHAQLLAASYQHALLRDAYAVAKALGRILVLPPVYAWCDWEPDAHVLLTCVTVHNEGQVPYQGPSDLYVNIEAMDASQYVPYREHSFLSHPSVPRHVLWDRDTVYMYWPDEARPVRYAAGVNVVMDGNLTDATLVERLQGVQERRLLHFENLEPHAFAGFESQAANEEFERFHAAMRWEQKWCCLTNNHTHKLAGHQHIFYVQPTPLTQRPRLPWPVPQYALPDFCSPEHGMPLRPEDEVGAREIWRSPNHSCVALQPGVAPRLPKLWTRDVSTLRLPVDRDHVWAAFEVPGDMAPWLDSSIAADGRGSARR